MNTDDYKAQLLQQKKDYETRIQKITDHQKNPDSELQEHWDDQAIIARQSDMRSLLLAEAQSELDKVNAALLRIDNGTYGVCTTCHNAIDEQRLQALPSANTCIDHA